MAEETALAVNVFGAEALVSSLEGLRGQLRFRLFAELKALARAYAEDVVSSGLAEQGIKSRTGNLRRNMVVKGKLTQTFARALVYPGAKDERGYRYPWALGKGSKKNQIDVKPYVRAPRAGEVGGEVTLVGTRGGVRKAGKRYGARQRIEFRKYSGVVRVEGHSRHVRLPPRPFMSGGALTRLEAVFARRMETAVRQAITDVTTTARLAAELEAAGETGAGAS